MDAELKNSILKTGTAIMWIVCREVIVMASNRKVTLGEKIVGSKDLRKTNKLNDYLVISWAGGMSDAQRLSKLMAAELRLKELKSKLRPTVKQSANLISSYSYLNIRQPSMIPSIVGTLLGGFNEDGSVELYAIGADGSIHKVNDYDAGIGSGMPYVLGLLERQYKKDLTIEQGVELAIEALKSSTQRDVGSGYGIDIFTITKEGINLVLEQEIIPQYIDKK